MTEKNEFIGRILSANSRECVVGYRAAETAIPEFGSMVRIPIHQPESDIYGIVTDIQIEEDGFLRQIATADTIPEEVMLDTRVNRNVPVVLRILFLGTVTDGKVSHLLPPRPPLSLDEIYQCTDSEISSFTNDNLSYLRFILQNQSVLPSELAAVHVRLTAKAHAAVGDGGWACRAVTEIIDQMRDDYEGLIAVLTAIGDADISCSLEDSRES